MFSPESVPPELLRAPKRQRGNLGISPPVLHRWKPGLETTAPPSLPPPLLYGSPPVLHRWKPGLVTKPRSPPPIFSFFPLARLRPCAGGVRNSGGANPARWLPNLAATGAGPVGVGNAVAGPGAVVAKPRLHRCRTGRGAECAAEREQKREQAKLALSGVNGTRQVRPLEGTLKTGKYVVPGRFINHFWKIEMA